MVRGFGSGFRIHSSGFRVSGWWYVVSCSGFGVFEVRVFTVGVSRFGVSRSGFRLQGSGFGVSGMWFKVSCLGFLRHGV